MSLVDIGSDGRTRCRATIGFVLGLCLVAAASFSTCASTVDDVVAIEMKEHHILGVSLAIIEKGEIRQAKGYGFTDQTRKTATHEGRCQPGWTATCLGFKEGWQRTALELEYEPDPCDSATSLRSPIGRLDWIFDATVAIAGRFQRR